MIRVLYHLGEGGEGGGSLRYSAFRTEDRRGRLGWNNLEKKRFKMVHAWPWPGPPGYVSLIQDGGFFLSFFFFFGLEECPGKHKMPYFF